MERIKPLHLISDYLSGKSDRYKEMNERFVKIPWYGKVAGAITTVALAACSVGEKFDFVTPPPEGTATNSSETLSLGNQSEVFRDGYRVGLDIRSREFVVLDESGNIIGPLGDGKFENGVEINILFHLRGEKVLDIPWGWSVKDQYGNIIDNGRIKIVGLKEK